MSSQQLREAIRCIPDFPKPGIQFRDITPILRDPELTRTAVRLMTAPFADSGITAVVGIESRGFLFGAMMAQKLKAGFVPARKEGRLPRETIRERYELEYGSDAVEVQAGDLNEGDVVLIHDDLIATGGTARATRKLVERSGAYLAGFSFLIELQELGGGSGLEADVPVHSIVQYS